jgi:hypothetical protein
MWAGVGVSGCLDALHIVIWIGRVRCIGRCTAFWAGMIPCRSMDSLELFLLSARHVALRRGSCCLFKSTPNAMTDEELCAASSVVVWTAGRPVRRVSGGRVCRGIAWCGQRVSIFLGAARGIPTAGRLRWNLLTDEAFT